MSKCIVLLALSASTAFAAGPQGVNLAELTDWDIIVASDAIPSEAYAAEELQSHFEMASGIRLPIVHAVERADRHIFVGPGEALASSAVGFGTDEFGPEDLRIVIRDGLIAIAGGRPRGTLYGVYTFLEDYLGVRFLSPDHTHVPKVGAWRVVGPVDRFYHPPLAFRWSFYAETNWDPVFAARNRTNTVPTEPRLGGKTGLTNINHSLLFLLPSQTYGKEHPEYYALVDGKRVATVANDGVMTQPCLTNPDVLRIVTDRVLGSLRSSPGVENVSVSQNDNTKYCRCPDCAAIDEREGTPMGSLLTFVNAVADEVAKEFPDVLVGTLAYSYSRKPPRTIRPRPNVQIQLCSIECSMIQPINDPGCELNVEFCRDLDEWGKICDNVSIWCYNTNFAGYQLPCPNLRVIEPNIRHFVANHAIGVFMQGVYNTLSGEFSDLRNYMTANLLWDPNRSGQQLMDEFLDLHYGRAADPIRRFINLVHDNAEARGIQRNCSGSAADFGIDDAIIEAGFNAFDEALRLADDDTVRDRVEKASMCVYCAAIDPLASAMSAEGIPDPDTVRRLLPLAERFNELCAKYGVTKTSEGVPFREGEMDLPVDALCGRRVVQLPEQWRFRLDPDNVGEQEAWFAQPAGAAWKPISIHSAWEGQGYEGYDGYGWYSVEIEIPPVEERRVWLLCGAVDETFKLWINGEYVGASEGEPTLLWCRPVALDITGKYTPGATTRITMRVHDVGYAGGIWKPIWVTAAD
ncbi:MAG: DUF4838 domain-containing protein [Candidatus Hydrogenedentes bacterium]|nr:DUF4838 domain-containing protein [Candidatus Hydrogenedentota bacterium]